MEGLFMKIPAQQDVLFDVSAAFSDPKVGKYL
jgi:hypothetical protein